jgi:hypothetical protein
VTIATTDNLNLVAGSIKLQGNLQLSNVNVLTANIQNLSASNVNISTVTAPAATFTTLNTTTLNTNTLIANSTLTSSLSVQSGIPYPFALTQISYSNVEVLSNALINPVTSTLMNYTFMNITSPKSCLYI